MATVVLSTQAVGHRAAAAGDGPEGGGAGTGVEAGCESMAPQYPTMFPEAKGGPGPVMLYGCHDPPRDLSREYDGR
jgi:hypothetical protein